MVEELSTIETAKEKENLLKTSYTEAFITMMKDTGRGGNVLNELEDLSFENYTWYCI